MRYQIEIYNQDKYLEVAKFLEKNEWRDIPPPSFLRDFGLICRDIKLHKIVGFVHAMMSFSDMAFVTYWATDKIVRNNKLRGNRVFYLLLISLEAGLKGAGKRGYIGLVEKDNDLAQKIYTRHGGVKWGTGDFYRKEISYV